MINIYSRSADWRARRLSNFSADEFVIDGETIASVEGFIQGIKFPEDDSRRRQAFQCVGVGAKRLGQKAPRLGYVWWKGKQIVFGSDEHRCLIISAIRAKFKQNREALDALLNTENEELVHTTSRPEPQNPSIPTSLFCKILMEIREEQRNQKRIGV